MPAEVVERNRKICIADVYSITGFRKGLTLLFDENGGSYWKFVAEIIEEERAYLLRTCDCGGNDLPGNDLVRQVRFGAKEFDAVLEKTLNGRQRITVHLAMERSIDGGPFFNIGLVTQDSEREYREEC